MKPSELKYKVEQAGNSPYFFDRKTMKFFGDTMKNYGVRKCSVLTNSQISYDCFELYRKRPVKNNNHSSAYFNQLTLERVYPAT